MTGQGQELNRVRVVDEVARCRASMADGELSHAVGHLGRALELDPAFQPAYAALAEVAVAAGSSEAARELFKGDGRSVASGNAAAIVALLAGEGRTADAVSLLGGVVAARPEAPWAAAPWFGPHLADTVLARAVGIAVSKIYKVVGVPARPETRTALAPWLELSRATAARPETGPDVLCAMSALARRLGAATEAIAWCQAAELRQQQAGTVTSQPLVMLGYAYQSADQPAEAAKAWKRAIALEPGSLPLYLDLADLYFGQGDFAQSRHWAERAVGLDGSAVKPRGAALAARYRESVRPGEIGDLAPLIELADLAREHPDVPYLRSLLSDACEGGPWLRVVPVPTEALAQAAVGMGAADQAGSFTVPGTRRIFATTLEAPSAVSAFRARFPDVLIEVGQVPKPDMRVAVTTDFGPPLWSYEGTVAVPSVSVPVPSAQAVAILHRVASGMWGDPLVAYERAVEFGRLDASDLLGLLAHVPKPVGPAAAFEGVSTPLYWERIAQVWVCVGILHHRSDEPWARSARRALLLRLLFGPEDWTVDAAAFALCVSAWAHPQQRAEISGAITQRYLHAAKAVGKRPTELHDPLARVLLICPGADQKIVRQARGRLAERARESSPPKGSGK
jgi:tetratricopeptide (TPR) repeat protein